MATSKRIPVAALFFGLLGTSPLVAGPAAQVDTEAAPVAQSPSSKTEPDKSEPAPAPEPEPEQTAFPAPRFGDEIFVTARKVSEKLQSVPTSISVFRDSDLESQGIDGFDDLRSRVPNLQYYDFNIGLPHFFIRGIGSVNRSGASDTAVGVFVDDVYMARGLGPTSDFFDMERVEVLRGPQGTFFGRNSVGGAVALHTKRPVDSFEASLSVRTGNHERFDLEGVFNLPLGRRAAARVAVLKKSYEGNGVSTVTGNHLEDEDRLATRASLKLAATEDITLLVSADLTQDEANGNWWTLGAEGPFSIGNSNPDPRRGPNQIDGIADRDDWGTSARLDWTTPRGTLTSISAWRRHRYRALDNTTGLFVAELDDPDRFRFHHTLFVQGQRQDSRQVTQELRWSSPPEARASWIAGLFFLDEQIERHPTTFFKFIFFNSEGEFGHDARNDINSYALFGQAEYRFGHGVSIAAGWRATEDRKRHSSSTFGQHFLGFQDQGRPVDGWTARASDRWSEITPSFSLSYQLSADLMAYAAAAKGFKSGGFNDEGAERALVATPFAPEIAWNYEIGLKSVLWRQRGRVNASAFLLDYTDLQVEQFIQPDPTRPPVEITTNAGSATIKGVEVEWDVKLPGRVSLFGSYAYLDTRINDLTINGVGVAGNRLAYAPKQQFHNGLEYACSPSGRGAFAIRAGYSYQSDSFGDIGNSDVILLRARSLVDADLAWTPPGGRWRLALWGKNLTDELYAVTATEVPVSDRYEKYGPPRTFGVTVRRLF